MSVSDATVFDVIILGAGPAGSTCALALGDSGLRVALLEKSSFPRQKTCGDAVAAYVPKVLATISRETSKRLDDFSEKLPVNTCRFVAPNRRTFDIRFNETGFISRRIDFDNFLFAEAASRKNISVFQEHYATDVSITPNGVTVTAGDKVFS